MNWATYTDEALRRQLAVNANARAHMWGRPSTALDRMDDQIAAELTRREAK